MTLQMIEYTSDELDALARPMPDDIAIMQAAYRSAATPIARRLLDARLPGDDQLPAEDDNAKTAEGTAGTPPARTTASAEGNP